MLNFRNTNILFLLLFAAAAGFDRYYGIPLFVYPLIIVLYLAVLFYGCYSISSNFFLPVYCAAATTEKIIALSFDDGPANQFTRDTLKVLHDHNVKAAFFCIGKRIRGNESILRKLHESGHLIGNHSYSHGTWFDLLSSGKMARDLKRMNEEMYRVTGLRPRLFRPPYGVINPNLKKAILSGGYIPVGWSVRSLDTVITNEERLFKKVSRALKPGAIFLFHDTSSATLAILPKFLRHVRENGYEIVRLDKMLHLTPYA
jgi:peptidoglycan/xylan/chitin deacetylase (PgdA/CDA1 family)